MKKNNFTKSSWTVCVLFLGATLGARAFAIDGPETEFTPKSFALVDANGVDIPERSFNLAHSISIGDPANGGMTYSVSYSSAGTWKQYHSVLSYVRHDVFQDPDTGIESEAWALFFNGASEQI